MSSVQVESIGTDSKEIAMQEASLDIWDKKYRLKSKSGEPPPPLLLLPVVERRKSL